MTSTRLNPRNDWLVLTETSDTVTVAANGFFDMTLTFNVPSGYELAAIRSVLCMSGGNNMIQLAPTWFGITDANSARAFIRNLSSTAYANKVIISAVALPVR